MVPSLFILGEKQFPLSEKGGRREHKTFLPNNFGPSSGLGTQCRPAYFSYKRLQASKIKGEKCWAGALGSGLSPV